MQSQIKTIQKKILLSLFVAENNYIKSEHKIIIKYTVLIIYHNDSAIPNKDNTKENCLDNEQWDYWKGKLHRMYHKKNLNTCLFNEAGIIIVIKL